MLSLPKQEEPLSKLQRPRPGSWQVAAWRFIGLWLIVSLFALVYRLHPYYHRPYFVPFQSLVVNAYVFFCGYGFSMSG